MNLHLLKYLVDGAKVLKTFFAEYLMSQRSKNSGKLQLKLE